MLRIVMRAAVLGVAALTVLSCGSGSTESKRKPPERRTQTYEFGTARQGTVLHHTFQVTNATGVALTVARVQTTCGCTVATVKKNTVVEAGKVLEVPVDLNLRGKHNPVESKVIVNYTNDAIPDELVLKGRVSEEYKDNVSLPKAKRGEQPEQVVEFTTYPGQPPLKVEDVEFDATKFDVTTRAGEKEGTYDVTIKPALGAPYGSVVDQIVVKTNDTEVPEKPIGVHIHIAKPLEATTPQLVLHPGKEGEPIAGVAEFTSTYGEPITDARVSITREKRFSATLEPGAPAGTVRVRVTYTPPENNKNKPQQQATLRVSAKVGDNPVDERMSVLYTIQRPDAARDGDPIHSGKPDGDAP